MSILKKLDCYAKQYFTPLGTFALLTYFGFPPWFMLSALRLITVPMFLHELLLTLGGPQSQQDSDFKTGDYAFYDFYDFEIFRLVPAVCFFPFRYIFVDHSSKDCEALEDTSNPDIVGSGVRLSMYILFFAVFASLFIGSFHGGPSGTKELGVATLINLISLSINLLKVKTGDLSPTDVFVVLVMVDTHCVALSATLSSKDALASRSYVWMTVVGQAVAWLAVLYTDIRFVDTKPEHCMQDVWFESAITPGKQLSLALFRTYWISHSYDLIQSGVLALFHTKRFDELEKEHRQETSTDDQSQTSTDDQSQTSTDDQSHFGYGRLPSTAFSNWRGFVLYPIHLVVAVEHHLSKNEINVGDFREWGQSFTLITCACATLHWVYVNSPLLKHALICLRHGSWIPHRGPVLPTNTMRFLAIGERASLGDEYYYDLLRAGD